MSYYNKYKIYSIVANTLNDDQRATEFISWQWNFKKISRITYYKIYIKYKMLYFFKREEEILEYIISVVSDNEEDKEIYLNILYCD